MSDFVNDSAPDLPFSKTNQLARPWNCKAGVEDCTRTEPCRSCLGRRNRRKGATKQRAARKALGVPANRFGSQNANEENWRWLIRAEVKAGLQVKALTTRFLNAERQSDEAKAIGDPRPFAFVAMPDGMSDGIVAVRLSTWNQLIVPLLEQEAGECTGSSSTAASPTANRQGNTR